MTEFVPFSTDPYKGPDRAAFLYKDAVWKIVSFTVTENLKNAVASVHYRIERYVAAPKTNEDYIRMERVDPTNGFVEFNLPEPDYLKWSNPASIELVIMQHVLESKDLPPVDHSYTNDTFGKYHDVNNMNVVAVQHSYAVQTDTGSTDLIEMGYYLRSKDEYDLYPDYIFNSLGKINKGFKFHPVTIKELQDDYIKDLKDAMGSA